MACEAYNTAKWSVDVGVLDHNNHIRLSYLSLSRPRNITTDTLSALTVPPVYVCCKVDRRDAWQHHPLRSTLHYRLGFGCFQQAEMYPSARFITSTLVLSQRLNCGLRPVN
jgi:hypothetical protein